MAPHFTLEPLLPFPNHSFDKLITSFDLPVVTRTLPSHHITHNTVLHNWSPIKTTAPPLTIFVTFYSSHDPTWDSPLLILSNVRVVQSNNIFMDERDTVSNVRRLNTLKQKFARCTICKFNERKSAITCMANTNISVFI